MTIAELMAQLRSRNIVVWAEGDRLRYDAPPNALSPDLRARLVAHKADLLALLSRAKPSADLADFPPLPRGPEALPVSFAQQRLWFIDQLQPGSPQYNMPSALELRGALDVPALARALSALAARHEALRTTFHAGAEGQPVARVHPPAPIPLPVEDLSQLDEAAQRQAVAAHTQASAERPFDLARGPLLRAGLLRTAADRHILLLTMHHIVADGWSIGVLAREFPALYAAARAGQTADLAPLPLQYADYAAWQRATLTDEALAAQVEHWTRHLSGAPELLDLPTDRPRPPISSGRGATLRAPLGPELLAGIDRLVLAEAATPFMVLLASWAALLARWSGQTDLVIGTPVAGRTHTLLEGLIGMFVNTLALRVRPDPDQPFQELLRQVRAVTLDGFAHQDVPFERLVEALAPARSLSHNPLFQVMFTYAERDPEVRAESGLTLRALEADIRTTHFDLSLMVERSGPAAEAVFEYSTELFDDTTIARLAEQYQTLLAGALAQPRLALARLPLLPPSQRRLLLEEWNATEASLPAGRCLHELIAAQAARTPGAAAVVCAEDRLTYAELDARANRLAHALQARGVGPETLVAICIGRSLDMAVALLGVLKAGAAYLPIEPAYPPERRLLMLHDSRAHLLLESGPPAQDLPGLATPRLDLAAEWPHILRLPDTPPASPVAPDNLAYVIYTSGSTGAPKGVQIAHRSVVNHNQAVVERYGLRPGDRVLQFATLAFDAAVEEIFPTWISGATLVLRPPEPAWGPAELLRFADRHELTVLNLPTAYWHLLVEELDSAADLPASLRLVVVGGEAASAEHLARWRRRAGPALRWVNTYGPTETTVIATAYEPSDAPAGQTPPIGRPIANTQLYILDRAMQPLPIGAVGELYIGGVQLARGYQGRPDLTAERFVPNPFGDERRTTNDEVGAGATLPATFEPSEARISDGSRGEDGSPSSFVPRPSSAGDGSPSSFVPRPSSGRLYKTGDLARYRADGQVEYVGRGDYQVKLRGFRIELGEIEAVLRQSPLVADAALVVSRERGEQRLAAYVVPAGARLPATDAEGAPGDGGRRAKDEIGAEQELSSTQERSTPLPLRRSSAPTLAEALREHLAARLPEYMLPAVFVPLAALPLTPSGKLDRRALPAPDWSGAAQTAFVAPRTPAEQALAEIWAEVLRLERVGVHDNFFDLGGHSLTVMRLLNRIERVFGRALSVAAIFQAPTVAQLARALDSAEQPARAGALVGLRPEGAGRPLFFVHPIGGNVLCYVDLARRLDAGRPFYGLAAPGIDGRTPPLTSVEALAAHYLAAVRAAGHAGPLLLGGWSMGGVIAFEMALQLQREGAPAPALFLLDSWATSALADPEDCDDAQLLAWFADDWGLSIGADLRVSAEAARRLGPEQQLEELLARAKAAGAVDQDADAALVRPLLDVFKANMQALYTYRPLGRHRGALVLLRAAGSAESGGPSLGWEAWADRVEVQTVPGDHYSMIREPHAGALARALAERLGEADRG